MLPLLWPTSPTMTGMHSTAQEFQGFGGIVIIPRTGLSRYQSRTDRNGILPMSFDLYPTLAFCAEGGERTRRPFPRSYSNPVATVNTPVISSLNQKDAKHTTKLKECMIRSEWTRQWINKHIKNTRSSCEGGGVSLPKKKGSTINCHSAGISTSKRFFRLRGKLAQLREKDLKPAGATMRRLGGVSTGVNPGKSLAQARRNNGTSGDLHGSNNRNILVSDFLRNMKAGKESESTGRLHIK
jgi:hypothetical protein